MASLTDTEPGTLRNEKARPAMRGAPFFRLVLADLYIACSMRSRVQRTASK